MRILNRSENPNTLVGIFLLVLLAVFVGPNVLPRIVASFAPNIDESIPCAWLRSSSGRANHQSLLGRAAVDPIRLIVKTTPIPNTADATFTIRLTVINESLGTIPIVYNENEVILGDNGTSGLGLLFSPGVNLPISAARQDAGSFPESDIRLLGPRQRCVHRIDVPGSQVSIGPGTQVRAFYRITTAGQTIQSQGAIETPIYNDQGLDVLRTGYVESAPFDIPLTIQ